MENYRILERLGKGAQGSVHLAEHRKTNERFVLKKIECSDESEANKAFKEALALKELKHPYICGYQEFFVHWEKEESAMYICIVMDYCRQGDLAQFMKLRHENNHPIEETTIKKWLGQILEALIFVHKSQIIHRDLKPSNVLLMDDMSVCLADFGVATVISDMRTNSRSTVGSMNWTAPEVQEGPYDARSDVWSVGCIALEFVSCVQYDTANMAGKLIEIKHNSSALEDMLSQASQVYSAELLSVIKTMLERKCDHRPTALELSEVPYIKECLALSAAIMAQRNKRHSSAPPGGKLPRDSGLEEVMDYLGTNLNNEDSVRQALEYGSQLVLNQTLDGASKRLVVRAMTDYLHEVDIQIYACRLLSTLMTSASADDFIYSNDVISAVTQAMKTHTSSSDLLQAAAALLVAISADETAAQQIGAHGGLHQLLTAIRSFMDSAELCTTCCRALWSLTVNDDNARLVSEENGIKDIVATVERHFKLPTLVETACAALFSLSVEEQNLGSMNSLDVVPLLLRVLQYHSKEANVVKNACWTLATMAEADEESAYRLLNEKTDGDDRPGLPLLADTYTLHRDNPEVVESLCSLILELAQYDEIRAEINHLKLGENVVSVIQKHFKDSQNIMKLCEAALQRLGLKKTRKL